MEARCSQSIYAKMCSAKILIPSKIKMTPPNISAFCLSKLPKVFPMKNPITLHTKVIDAMMKAA